MLSDTEHITDGTRKEGAVHLIAYYVHVFKRTMIEY